VLLAVAASRWLVADIHPEAAPSPASAALGCGWAAVVALTLLDKDLGPAKKWSGLRSLLAGAMLLGGPATGLLIGAHELSAAALTMALALTPVAVAVGVAAFWEGTSQGIAGRIWPGLAAVTGLLLILVQPSLLNMLNDVALLLAPTLTGLGAALFAAKGDGRDDRKPSNANALLGAAALFTFATLLRWVAAGHRPVLSLLAIAYEGVLALLSVMALSRLGPMRWSSQFTWLPLLILLEGIVMMRPPVTARWLTGLLVLAIASVYLLMPQEDESVSRTTLG
jgi:hypothetical protein